ncbi:hypothetical protein GQR58_029859 [Nymphon striatum]|nr:hypothetical protein GQR58_029859 [Nymphon striatum]
MAASETASLASDTVSRASPPEFNPTATTPAKQQRYRGCRCGDHVQPTRSAGGASSETDHAGTAVGADNGADQADLGDVGIGEFQELVDVTSHAVTNCDVGGIGGQLACEPGEGLFACALAAGFFDFAGAQIDARLDRQQGANHGLGAADAAALLQVVERVEHTEHVGAFGEVFGECDDGGCVGAAGCGFGGAAHDHALANGCRLGVNNRDRRAFDLGRGGAGRLERGRQAERQVDADNGGGAIGDQFVECFEEGARCRSGGFRQRVIGCHLGIELLGGELDPVGVFVAAEANAQGHNFDAEFVGDLGGQITAAVGDDANRHGGLPGDRSARVVASPARTADNLMRNCVIGGSFGGGQDLVNRGANAGAQVDGFDAVHVHDCFDRGDVAIGQIAHVDVVADGRAVGGVVVVAEDLERVAAANGDLHDERHEVVWFADRVFADQAARVGADRVEVAQVDRGQLAVFGDVADDLFDHELGAAVGIDCRLIRAADIGGVVVQGLLGRFAHGLEAGEVDYGIDVVRLKERLDAGGVSQIQFGERHGRVGNLGHTIQYRGGAVGEVVEADDAVAPFEQGNGDMAGDIAGRTGQRDGQRRHVLRLDARPTRLAA